MFGVVEFGVYIDIYFYISIIFGGLKQLLGKFVGEEDQLVIVGFGNNYDILYSMFDGLMLQLFGYFLDISGGLYQVRM